uniref:Zinc/iron permease n=1 Tax=Tetradesmus obliquus TaxID=3088 RepID=A0A383VUD7_TETOB|eukprot:jgi/Sobl393_1/9981/SZX68449.1
MAVILVGGLAGVLPPLLGKWLASPDSVTGRAVRAFSGGAILGVALIHIIPEGMELMSDVAASYHGAGGLPVAAGLLLLLFIDYLATYLLAGRQLLKQQQQQQRQKQAAANGQQTSNLHACCPVSGTSSSAAAAAAAAAGSKGADLEQGAAAPLPGEAAIGTAATGMSPFAHSHHHLPACAITTIKHLVTCYSMEAGCVFHSVIIGISIGVTTNAPLLVTLAAVMVFHQALEGLALGSVLALTQLSMLKKLSMAAVFALCMPFGVAVGLAIAGGHDADSLPWLAAQGVLNGVSGGMLLYVSMYSLLAEEFSKTDLIYRPGVAALLAAAVVAGVGSMAVIGIWG